MTYRRRTLKHVLLLATTGLFLSACGGGDSVGDTKDSPETPPFFPAPEEEWELVWSDEFDGDTLNTANWGYDLGDGSDRGLERWGNNEQQWYTDQNASVSDGTLKISARAESVQDGFPYTSSRITTLDKLDFTYGRVEASLRTSSGQGLWGAFWMLSSDSPYGSDGWAATGEIDIMEAANPGVDTQYYGSTIFHGFPWPLQQSISEAFPADVDPTEFNEYAVEWEQNEIRFLVNDIHFKTITSESYYSYFYNEANQGYELAVDGAPFNTDFHLILNLAVGGNLTGNTVDDASLPGELEVDYVRVYSCSYGRADGKGCNSNVNPDLETPDPLRPAQESFDIYIDEPALYSWTINGETYDRPLALNSFWNNDGALTFAEVDAGDRGNVIEVITSNSGNISINPTVEPIELFGMGNNPNFWELHAGELRFDIYVRSADAESTFLVKMDSGYPALGQVALAADNFPRDTWTTVSVKVNDLLAFRGDGFMPLDTSSIQSMFVFEPTGAADVLIDNITLSCGAPGSCGISAPVPPAPPIEGPFAMAGIWAVAPEAGSLGVGPTPGDISWWAIDDQGVSDRACFYDDTYVFNEDGSFQNVLGDDTWLEEWQSGNPEACGAPVEPHDGMTAGTWSYDGDAGTLLIDGFGSYVGIPKAVNAGELPGVPTPPNVTYNIEEVGNDRMIVTVESGTGIWWQFVMQKLESFGTPGPAPERTFAGTWQVEPVAGSLGVGPARGDISWWAIDDAGVTTRACFYDDEYVFDRDGTFDNVLGDDTWLEAWQGVTGEECGTPVAPHDGAADYTWTYTEATEDTGTLLIDGLGGYMGIPKAVNAGELPAVSVPANVTYEVTWENDNTVIIDIEAGPGVWWRYRMIKTVQPAPVEVSPVVGTWRVAPEANSLGVGPALGDISWWAIDDAGVTTRACFYDDDYVFMEDGTFDNVLGDDTWLEAWQGVTGEECGTPVAPHDGAGEYTWDLDMDAGTITINGVGGYLGIPKAVNNGELGNGGTVSATTVYMVEFTDNDTRMTVDIEAGTGVWWRFIMEKQ
ncbi:glycoside hydrolase family 16 protein [Alteromonas sp. ASW11-36]|uniref:Glycoside hydrolase family 16 protein n=1 Tax=Alteromonas arenosi TaxID=3055817 RepID=A0ABT7SW48_9ALTE|nr:glycoside hydrolase family 16 protein [Alteromonas sp. ASW11-36]MDM7860386.1 glycoside hydrolase family 16 protein [Alteromonas sp. ASW11-36]